MSSLVVILNFVQIKMFLKKFFKLKIFFFIIYFNFDVVLNPYISKSKQVKVLIFYTTVALCTVN